MTTSLEMITEGVEVEDIEVAVISEGIEGVATLVDIEVAATLEVVIEVAATLVDIEVVEDSVEVVIEEAVASIETAHLKDIKTKTSTITMKISSKQMFRLTLSKRSRKTFT